MIGQEILGYTVDEKIGEGGFGTVYKVSKTNAAGTYVRALKHMTVPTKKQYADVLNSMGGDYSKADDYFAGVLKEIVNEIQIISGLTEAGARNIVRYYENDIQEQESPRSYDIYILMEYLKPFPDYFLENQMTVKDVIRLGKDILTALESCHENNVIHRDIKDDNIFVGKDGSFKLGDFGVSKVLKDRSRAESMKGTPNFIAPEVYLGKEKYDNTVDLYSLGIVLYRLLNKSRNPFMPVYPAPYTSDDEDAAFDKRMKGEVPELPYDAKNVLGEVILGAICPRKDRYSSAGEFAARLEEAEKQLSEAELSVVVNTVVPDKKTTAKNETVAGSTSSSRLQETVAADNSFELKMQAKEQNNKHDEDLFRSVSDSFQPVSPQPILKESGEKKQQTNSADRQPQTPPPAAAEPLENTSYSYNSSNNQGPRQVEAITKSSKRKIVFAFPFIFAIAIIVLYLILPKVLYGKGVSFVTWLISDPNTIVDKLVAIAKNPDAVFLPYYAVIALKVLGWLLVGGFITSLFFVGKELQNAGPEANVRALLMDNEPYLKTIELYDTVKIMSGAEAKRAGTAIKRVSEKLRNETKFGYGKDSVINCENEIAKCLSSIEENVRALTNKDAAAQAAINIESNCNTIMSKLKIREQLKRN